MSRQSFTALLAISAACLTGVDASAQLLGAYHWQLAPYCNVLTIKESAQGPVVTLDGYDDQCGAGPRASVVGTGVMNADGSMASGWPQSSRQVLRHRPAHRPQDGDGLEAPRSVPQGGRSPHR